MPRVSKLLDYLHLGLQSIRENLAAAIEISWVRLVFIIAVGLHIASWLVAYTIRLKLENNLSILSYNVNFGANLIGTAGEIYFLPQMVALAMVVNMIFFMATYHRAVADINRTKLLTGIVLGSLIVVNVLLLLYLFSVYLINFY